ncbi:MAG: integrin [Kofleriaceae bacterium]
MRVFAALVLVTACTWDRPPEIAPPVECEEDTCDPNIELHATFGLKQLELSWTPYDGATEYHVLAGNADSFVDVGSALPPTTLSVKLPLSVHRIDWANASYRLQACTADRCIDSPAISITESMVSTIGYLKASNTDFDDKFGFAIALSGDGTTLAVGAPHESANASGDPANNDALSAGAVYILHRGADGWEHQAYLKASNAEPWDEFGRALAISDDGNTVVVGVRPEDGGSAGIGGNPSDNTITDSGAVYVFARNGVSWHQETYLKATNPSPSDFFGTTVALSADGKTLAVGAYYEDSGSPGIDGPQNDESVSNAGAVYVYKRSGNSWSHDAYIKASNPGVDAAFGAALALSNDGSILAVGSPGERSASEGINGSQVNAGLVNAGAVYAFRRAGGSWVQQAYIKSSHMDANDHFGFAVALDADGDTLAVGCKGESSAATGTTGDPSDNDAENAGTVFVFSRSNTAWSQQAHLKSSFTNKGYELGWRVAVSDDGDMIAASAPGDASASDGVGGTPTDQGAPNAGAVALFTRSGISWSQTAYVKAPNSDPMDRFGLDVALSGDASTLAVSAPSEAGAATGVAVDVGPDNNAAVGAGAVYLY